MQERGWREREVGMWKLGVGTNEEQTKNFNQPTKTEISKNQTKPNQTHHSYNYTNAIFFFFFLVCTFSFPGIQTQKQCFSNSTTVFPHLLLLLLLPLLLSPHHFPNSNTPSQSPPIPSPKSSARPWIRSHCRRRSRR